MVNQGEFMGRLERLERLWGDLGSPLVELLRPGLSDEQIDELMAPTGLTLPDELRLWWGWHDGADAAVSVQEEGRRLGPGGWLHLPLGAAVKLHDHYDGGYRDLLAQGSIDIAEQGWRPGLFPFSHRAWQPNHVLAVDTLVPDHEVAPVIVTSEMGIESWAGANSFSEVIDIWIEALESGRYAVIGGHFETDPPGLIEQDARLRWLL